MKTILVKMFEAFDGTPFPTEEACRKFEEANWARRFAGLTEAQVDAALTRRDPDLADAFERAGQRIAQVRRDSGELRRTSPKRQDAATLDVLNDSDQP